MTLNAQIKVFSGGNITIGGLTTPVSGYTMHLWGNSLFSDNSFTGTSGNSAAFIRGLSTYSAPDNPDYTWWGDGNTGFFHPASQIIAFTNGGSESMRITDKGNLLLGLTSDADWKLSISANNKANLVTMNYQTVEYAYAHVSYVDHEKTKNWSVWYDERERFYVYGNGDVWSYTHYYSSDSTLKENIIKLHNSRDRVLQLRAVSYNFKPEIIHPNDTFTVLPSTTPKTEIGFLAQEVEQVVPEVVSTNDSGLKGIAYANLVALLIDAFKEEDSILTAVRSQLNVCCSKNSSHLKMSSGSIDSSNTERARLDQNIPNPFYTDTKISFYIPPNSAGKAIMVFNMEGLLLKQYDIAVTGESSITISGKEYKPGMYIYSLIIDGKEIDTKRMILTN